MRAPSRETWAWALYDWANSAFATTVLAGFFPVFFKTYWAKDLAATESTLRLGLAGSAASLLVAASAPVLGAIADRGGARKRLLAAFAAAGVVATAGLYLVGEGAWAAAAAVYVVATVAWSSANVFYDALLVSVAEPRRYDSVSALGFALGYLGGGLLFGVNVLMARSPEAFGLSGAGEAVRVSFLTVAGWWAVFTLPLLLLVREARVPGAASGLAAVRAGFSRLAATLRRLPTLRPVALFLLAYWLYIDGVDTIIRMAVDYGLALGFPQQSLVTALLVTQFVGFPAALVFGRLGERFGTRRVILAAIAVYAGVTVFGYFMDTVAEFYALAVAVGLVQGGLQSLSRAFFARLVPPEESAEFFGFYNMLGKLAAVLGPLLMGAVGVLTGSPRLAILSILVLFVLGAALLLLVPEPPREGTA